MAGLTDVAHWLWSKTSGTLLRSPAHELADTFQSTELNGENKSAPHCSSGSAGLYKRHSKAPGGTEEFGLMGSQAEFLCLWPSQRDKGCHPQIPFNPLMQHYWHLCLLKEILYLDVSLIQPPQICWPVDLHSVQNWGPNIPVLYQP